MPCVFCFLHGIHGHRRRPRRRAMLPGEHGDECGVVVPGKAKTEPLQAPTDVMNMEVDRTFHVRRQSGKGSRRKRPGTALDRGLSQSLGTTVRLSKECLV